MIRRATRTIYVRPRCGLGNRLLGLLSTIALARKLSASVVVIWEADNQCGAAFDELFESIPFENVIFSPQIPTAEWQDSMFMTGKLIQECIIKAKKIHFYASSLVAREIFPPGELEAAVAHLFGMLTAIDSLRRNISSIPKCDFGLHFRSTDHLPCQIASPVWAYRAVFLKIRKLLPSSKIFLCGDCDNAISYISDVHSDNCKISTFNKSRSEGVGSVQGALVDLMSLANCKTIVTSPLSSFGSLAAILKGARIYYVVAPPTLFVSSTQILAAAKRSWKIYRWIGYSFTSNSWSAWPKKRTLCEGIIAKLAICFVCIVRSGLYQRCLGDPWVRWRLSRSIVKFLWNSQTEGMPVAE